MKEPGNDSIKVARRRIRSIAPMTAGKVLGHRRYWTLPFLRLYLELCDETAFHRPEEGYLLGQHGPELARRIPEGIEDGYGSSVERQSWRVHALAVWGSCCRAAGELTQAESAYRLAFELAARYPISGDSRGELYVRRGVLAMVKGEERALEDVSLGLECFRSSDNRRRIADALTIRGLARSLNQDPESLVDLMSALELVEGLGSAGGRTLTTVLHNMALVISGGGVDIGAQELTYRLLTEVKRRLPRLGSVQKTKIVWVEGLLLARLGITRLAERRLLRARKGFRLNREPFELAAVTLDLVCFYLEEGELEAARRLAGETHDQVAALSGDPCLVDAAERWRGHLTLDESKAFQRCLWRMGRPPRVRPIA